MLASCRVWAGMIATMPAIHYINSSSSMFSIYEWSKTFSEHTGDNVRKRIRVHIFIQETKANSPLTHDL